MEDKMAAGVLGALCIMGEMALYLALLVVDNSYTL